MKGIYQDTSSKKKIQVSKRRKECIKLTSMSLPFKETDALAFAFNNITASLSPASCIEARINSAERMLPKGVKKINILQTD